jgi:hypothetical protein
MSALKPHGWRSSSSSRPKRHCRQGQQALPRMSPASLAAAALQQMQRGVLLLLL